MSVVILSLGTNVGDRAKFMTDIESALQKLSKTPLIKSPLYETEALGVKGQQENYYNRVVRMQTDLEPMDLLQKTQEIEQELGRLSKNDLAPRTADIDILLFENIVVDLPNLKIPHPRIFLRKFVIEGIKVIAGEFVLPKIADDFVKKGAKTFADYEPNEEVLSQNMKVLEA